MAICLSFTRGINNDPSSSTYCFCCLGEQGPVRPLTKLLAIDATPILGFRMGCWQYTSQAFANDIRIKRNEPCLLAQPLSNSGFPSSDASAHDDEHWGWRTLSITSCET